MLKRVLLVLLVLSLVIGQAQAQASVASRLGAEIAAVIKGKAAKRGFVASDPRQGAALTAIGSAVVDIAAAALVVGSGPAWGTVIASAAIAGAAAYGLEALANWYFNANGTVTYTPPAVPPPAPPTGGTNYIKGQTTGGSYAWYLLDANNGSVDWCNAYWTGGSNTLYTVLSSSGLNCYLAYSAASGSQGQPNPPPQQMGGQISSGKPTDGTPIYTPPPVANVPVTKTVAEALAGLTDQEKARQLDPKVVADIADAAWRHAAAQPGYAGIPYSLSDPVTAADVSAARAANPAMQVSTVGDLATPISATNPLGEVASPVGTVGAGTNPAAAQPLTNLGVDPGIGLPALEATPTGAQIVAPLTNLVPDLRNFQVPAHASSCPRPTFDLFGKQVVMDGQCTLFESVRGELYNAMLVTFLIIALFIILSA
jgi:hypothetical protein